MSKPSAFRHQYIYLSIYLYVVYISYTKLLYLPYPFFYHVGQPLRLSIYENILCKKPKPI